MANPKLESHPDTYKGEHWIPTDNCNPNIFSNDNCGVHTNSGVMNKWFYLLAEGGKGINDVKNYYTVYGIGKEEAAKIVYRAETVYFENRTNYEEARMWTMQAAMDLYGANSYQLREVCLAWYAVGLGEYKDICNTSVIMRGDENLCDQGTRAYELVFLPPTATVTWEVSPNLEIFTPGRENIAVRINPNQPISQSLGNGYVIAYVDGVPIWKNVWVGDPQIRSSETPPYIVYPDPFPTNSPFHKNLYLLGTNGTNIQLQGITSTNWELIGSSGECTPIFNVENDYQATLNANCENWTAQVEVSATNGCGTTTESITVQVVPQVYCYYLDIWTGQITIRPCENRREATTNSEKISKVSLHNYMGVNYGTYENTDTFPISKLPIGVYFVKIQLESGYIFTLKFIK